jgi:hypothetical protein
VTPLRKAKVHLLLLSSSVISLDSILFFSETPVNSSSSKGGDDEKVARNTYRSLSCVESASEETSLAWSSCKISPRGVHGVRPIHRCSLKFKNGNVASNFASCLEFLLEAFALCFVHTWESGTQFSSVDIFLLVFCRRKLCHIHLDNLLFLFM